MEKKNGSYIAWIHNRAQKRKMKINSKDIQKLCPFVNEPFSDCYIFNMKSQNTEAAIYYCGGHFEECEIYKRHAVETGGKNEMPLSGSPGNIAL